MRLPASASGLVRSMAALVLSMTICSAPSAHAAADVTIVNYTGFDGLESFIGERLDPELKQSLRARQLSVFVLAESLPGRNVCFALIGVSSNPPGDFHAPEPAHPFRVMSPRGHAGWDADDCRSEALIAAIGRFSREPLAAPVRSEEFRFAAGSAGRGKRTAVSPEPPTHISLTGLENAQDLFERMLRRDPSLVFEDRRVMLQLASDNVRIAMGSRMCVAFGGMAAMPAPGAKDRWPGAWESYAQFDRAGAQGGCQRPPTAKSRGNARERRSSPGMALDTIACPNFCV